MKPIRLLTVIGTRPEAIKMAPIAIATAARGIDHRIVATGQHGAIFHEALAAFGLAADVTLSLAGHGSSVEAMVKAIRDAVGGFLSTDSPDIVLVQGDTNSAYAGALAAHNAGIPIGHVEAGLRSHDLTLPWPEERNRVAIDALATLLFAPTELSRRNLLAEAVPGACEVTGNTGIDALLFTRARLPPSAPSEKRLLLVTCHRRENIGAGLAGICAALRTLAARGDVRIVLPVHTNPQIETGVRGALTGVESIELVDSLDHPEMVAHLAAAHIVLTDSGGLQEEAPALGVPVLVLRDLTERPEALATGNLALVGTDPEKIVAAAARLLDDPRAHAEMARPAFPYGRGDAATRILDVIDAWWEKG